MLLCGHQWEKKERKGELALTGALSLGPNDCGLETTTSQSQQQEREKPNGKVHGRCPPCLLASPQLDGCPEPESPRSGRLRFRSHAKFSMSRPPSFFSRKVLRNSHSSPHQVAQCGRGGGRVEDAAMNCPTWPTVTSASCWLGLFQRIVA